MLKEIKKHRENKQKAQLIKELNKDIENSQNNLLIYAKALSEDLAKSGFMFDVNWHFNSLRIREDSELELRWHTIEELVKTKELVADLYDEYKDRIDAFWEKAKANKEELNSIFEKGLPLFITLTSLRSDAKTYAMCYEIKKYNNGEFEAYWFTGGRKEGHLDTFTYLDYKIEPMTEEEFEQYYIMQRMGATNFDSESKAIEYDNELRRLFHGQREII